MAVRRTKYAVRERERRFLLRGVPEGLAAAIEISDTYLPGTRLRLRRTVEPDGTVTLKLGQKLREQGSRSILHTTFYVDEAEWRVLSTLKGQALRKDRYRLQRGELRVSVDVFGGPLAGLVLAEVDLGERDDAPDLSARLVEAGLDVVAEVTDDERYTGGELSASGVPGELHGTRSHPSRGGRS
jgi:CYTH domain-containing protein